MPFRRFFGDDVPRRAIFICQACIDRPSTPCARARAHALALGRAQTPNCFPLVLDLPSD
jgi:hypothetical protein